MMKYENIADIYSANQRFRENFAATLAAISADESAALPEGEKWSIQQIVEHVSMVDFGITRICAKLLASARAAAKSADGSFSLPPRFGERAAEMANLRVEAPERVQPTGSVTIAEALERIAANRNTFDSMRKDFESFDLAGETFPHPFFGDLTAGEWLVMAGLHLHRHAKQIENMAGKIRQ